jgi:pilus assembly protein CpaF
MRLSFTDKKRPAVNDTPEPIPATNANTPFDAVEEEDPELREYLNLKSRIHRALIQKMNLATLERMSAEQLRPEIDKAVSDILSEEGLPLSSSEKVRLTDDLIDELRGFGPLEPLLRDPTVSDILANTYREVYVERAPRH